MSKVIKEVWYICLDSLHRMLLPMLKWERQEGVQRLPAQFPKYHYTGRQCTALDITMDILKVHASLSSIALYINVLSKHAATSYISLPTATAITLTRTLLQLLYAKFYLILYIAIRIIAF